MTNQEESLIKKYNKPNNVLIISEYAHAGRATTGLSSFARNTTKSLKRHLARLGLDSQVVILADIVDGETVSERKEGLIIRCFRRGSAVSIGRLLLWVLRFTRVRQIIFEFEFGAFGNVYATGMIPFLLLVLRLAGKQVTFLMHQVVVDLKDLNTHLGLSTESRYLRLLERGLHMFYRIVGLSADKIIVLEEVFKRRLSQFVAVDKIVVVSHGIEARRPRTSTRVARRRLGYRKGDFVIMTFGFIARYKGIDKLIETVEALPSRVCGRRVQLLIAGGKSYAQEGKDHYERYYKRVVQKADTSGRITISGFVPDDKVSDYFQTADLVVLPYQKLISSSGPLSLAISYRKPLLLSRALEGYLHSQDFAQSLKDSKLNVKELFGPITPKSVKKTITNIVKNRSYGYRMRSFLSKLARRRVWYTVGRQYATILVSKYADRAYKFVFGYK